jgi:hypothetical protein
MKARSIERAGFILGVVILGAVVWYGHSDRLTLEGALWLMLASCLDLLSLLLSVSLRVKRGRNLPAPSGWVGRARAQVLVIAGWQSAAVGLLNIWAFHYSRDPVIMSFSYLLTVLFAFCCLSEVRFSDNPEQEGGPTPINYFGRPRARSLFFYGFCYVVLPIFVAAVRVYFLPKPTPPPFQPPQLAMLLVCLFSLASACLVVQRYQGPFQDRILATRISFLTVCIVAVMSGIEITFRHGTYLYVLSSLTIVCMAISTYSLLLAREGNHQATV